MPRQVPHHMQTYPSGSFIDLLKPKAESIVVKDMAHHLGMLCRFNGGVRTFYSVAEHCVLVGDLLDWMDVHQDDTVLSGYLHDAPEAFTSDLITPTKHAVRLLEGVEAQGDVSERSHSTAGVFAKLNHGLDVAVGKRFNVDPSLFHSPEVKRADNWALVIEARSLTNHDPILDWGMDLGDIPLNGMLPEEITWYGGLYPSQARDAFLRRLSDWGDWGEPEWWREVRGL